jgi:hypothetical protein
MSIAQEIAQPECVPSENKLAQFQQRQKDKRLEHYRDDNHACLLLQSDVVSGMKRSFIAALDDQINRLADASEKAVFQSFRLTMQFNPIAAGDLLLQAYLPHAEELNAVYTNIRKDQALPAAKKVRVAK